MLVRYDEAWKVTFHENAIKELDDLPKSMRNKFLAMFLKIETEGFSGIPRQSVKHMGDGLRELRTKTKDGIARSIYMLKMEQTIKILAVFVKKTPKTPKHILDLATKRRDEDADDYYIK